MKKLNEKQIQTFVRTLHLSGLTEEEINEKLEEAGIMDYARNIGNTARKGFQTFQNAATGAVQDMSAGLQRDFSNNPVRTTASLFNPATAAYQLGKTAYRGVRGALNSPQQPPQQPQFTSVGKNSSLQSKTEIPQQSQQQLPVVPPQQQILPQGKPPNLKPMTLTRAGGSGKWDVKADMNTGEYYDNTGKKIDPQIILNQGWMSPTNAFGPKPNAMTNDMPVQATGGSGFEPEEKGPSGSTYMPADGHSALMNELDGVPGKTFDYKVRNLRKFLGLNPKGGWDSKVQKAWSDFKKFKEGI